MLNLLRAQLADSKHFQEIGVTWKNVFSESPKLLNWNVLIIAGVGVGETNLDNFVTSLVLTLQKGTFFEHS